ncbi:MAG: hypothetical protein NC177_05390 [Ruminococcus flavefaciens]|nr:hypothetical protein [Ruminococcus flavefaciens]
MTAPLDSSIPKMYLKDIPKFDIGGKLTVSFSGEIILILFTVVMTIFYISV